ncbi:MAG: hypothetical protein H0X30_37650 [Anaerolineae bacterium]|nr:hypothetical protein [Anaerolineae bacterium]
MYVEAMVGFDVREIQSNFAEMWTPDRQALYLLRTDLDKPLSTDDMVWLRVFRNVKVDLPTWVWEPVLVSARIDLPAWVGPRHDTWENLKQMQAFMVEHRAELSPMRYWTIAITQCVSPEEVAAWYPIVPPDVAPEWTFLGYDVSDYFLLSGLMNCGYQTEDGDLKGQWAHKLNRYHLFDKMDDALAFAQFSDGRVKEHAPFFAYGIYVIDRY